MAVPKHKTELQNAIKTSYEKLRSELNDIPAENTAKKDMEGHAKGTVMSIINLLSYLIGWGELVLKWNIKKDRNETTDFPETGYQWNELGKLAQKFYTDYQDEGFETLTATLDQTVEKILKLVEKKSEKELYGISWYGKWTLGRMIQFNTSSPYTNARARIRKWKKDHDTKNRMNQNDGCS